VAHRLVTQVALGNNNQEFKFRPKARDVLVSWARATEYRNREAGYLRRARFASDPQSQNRLTTIARHYRSLAEIEQGIADRHGERTRDVFGNRYRAFKRALS
jgi:hypothetical protein